MITNQSPKWRLGIRLAAIVAAVSLLAVACGSDDGTASSTSALPVDTTPTSSVAAASTVAPTTTDAPATTAPASTTVAPMTTTVAPSTTTAAPPTTTAAPDTNLLAERSGCTPGTTDSLPDGEWFGSVVATTAGDLNFDLACWFTGDAAALAALEDGEESPPPNDYYVRNFSDKIRTIAVAADAAVTWLPDAGDPSSEELVTYVDWLVGRAGRDYQPGVWLIIEGGAITDIQEQFVP